MPEMWLNTSTPTIKCFDFFLISNKRKYHLMYLYSFIFIYQTCSAVWQKRKVFYGFIWFLEQCLQILTPLKSFIPKELCFKNVFVGCEFVFNGSIFGTNNVFIFIASVFFGWMDIMNQKQITISNYTKH